MNPVIVQSSGGITLVGGAPVSAALFRISQQRAPVIVAADGGADRCLAHGVQPQAVIGDMDSLSDSARLVLADRLHPIAEQDTTDFDKALRSIDAPFVIALGFIGARVDHGLAVLTTLVRQRRPCVLLGPQDVVFHAPTRLRLALRRGDRFSLYPLGRVTGTSTGLDWPIDGLDFAPDARVGTSNRVSTGPVSLELSGPGMLCILPRGRLDQALAALADTARADSRSR
ncbi:thiamine diphosphokinase [Pseudotabrizicola sediminis]|uniref:Thiamine diphosphokinase n=1 Tax=Pseudotabrizicola sediminis TaxID=2486418 RepID=A0ABY2KP55_9RHOB|nr:thiamine diphosphokinase [Pseudotabrizicola sediminis]TGD43083.1 thiamine diphosphokinase [Pseudotabrizicola sediminis]